MPFIRWRNQYANKFCKGLKNKSLFFFRRGRTKRIRIDNSSKIGDKKKTPELLEFSKEKKWQTL